MKNTFESMGESSSRFEAILQECITLYKAKDHDYGSAWQYLPWRVILYIVFYKAFRARVLIERHAQVNEKVEDTLRDIINWSVFTLIQMEQETKE